LSYYPQLVSRVTELAEQGHTTRQIADHLNAEGFRPPKRTSRFGPGQIRTLLNRHNITARQRRARPPALSGLGPGQWPVTALAAALNMPTATVYNWIYRGWVIARPSSDDRHWIITADAAEMQRLRQRRDRPPGFYTRARWAKLLDNPPTNDGAER
jgi:hypothetical protein